jgi:hypothetical protein
MLGGETHHVFVALVQPDLIPGDIDPSPVARKLDL